jgi:ribosomal protein S27AE
MMTMTNLNTTEPQFALPSSNCPRCSSNLSLNKATGDIACGVCGLEIIDSWMISDRISDSNEESDMETHLLPDEATIAAKEPKMQWQEAVTTIDKVIEDWLTDGGDVGGEVEANVRAAWHRILQG